jgi:hypothetical protein
MEQENIFLSEVSQVQKAKGCMFSLICKTKAQYKYKQYIYYIQSMHSKVGLAEETKGKGKKERKIIISHLSRIKF